MANARFSRLADRLKRQANGNPSTAIYGTIVAAGLIAAEGATGHSTPDIIVAMFGTLLVFWLAHAYAGTLAARITEGTSAASEVGHALRHEWPIVESGIPPAVVLVIGAVLGATVDAAVLAALIVAVAELCGWAVLACRRMGLTARKGVPYVLIAGLLGVLMIGLKLATH